MEEEYPPMRFAGEVMPAFIRKNGKFVPTEELKNVLSVMQSKTDVPLNIQPAPSPLTGLYGEGMWGTGGGVSEGKGKPTYVDPVRGSVTVAAHEAAHQGFPSSLDQNPFAEQKGNELLDMIRNKKFSDEDISSGKAMRVMQQNTNRALVEEANAQGVAYEAMRQAGYVPDAGGFRDMLEYPSLYGFGNEQDKGLGYYANDFNKPGLATWTPGEAEEFDKIKRAERPLMERQFSYGRGRLLQ